MAVKGPKGHWKFQQFPFQNHEKFIQTLHFGLKINHLATLLGLEA
jgi:hypothetical protein